MNKEQRKTEAKGGKFSLVNKQKLPNGSNNGCYLYFICYNIS